jgi:hypothetical protein
MGMRAKLKSFSGSLSYCADLIRVGFGGEAYFSTVKNVITLVGFTTAFLVVAWFFHDRARDRGL